MPKIDEEKIDHLLNRGVENIYPDRETLKKVLMSGKKIKLYCGYDPTAPSLHIGNAISMRKLAEFQKLGHEVIFLFGDFTAQLGDPDKLSVRKPLTHEEVLENLKGWKKQIKNIIDIDKIDFRFNSKWLKKMDFADIIDVAKHFTLQQIIARDMFQKRIEEGRPLYLHEFFYPLMQAYDSVEMDVDLEIGGSDQTFNILCGRDLMKSMKGKEKFVLTMKLLVDPSGEKMGKSIGNTVNLTDKPEDAFGKVMSWNDNMIVQGFEILTDIPEDGVKMFEKDLKNGANPREIKFKLAEEVVKTFFGEEASLMAGEKFNKQFRDHEKPKDIEEKHISQKMINVVELIFELGLAGSKSEARRLVEQGGVKIDDSKITDRESMIGVHDEMLVQVGKRKFVKIRV